MPSRTLAVLVLAAVAATGCGSGPAHAGHRAPSPPRRGAGTPTGPPTTPPTTMAAFASTVSPVTADELGATWHAGCPVGPDQLRSIEMTYWGFDSQAHTGTLVVNAAVVAPVTQVFATLYAARFPLQQMVPESAYGGDDDAAAAADDTSGFNCRFAVAPGPPQWSAHAYGEAIDVDDVQNPYVAGTTVIPPAGAAFEDRSDVRPGMAVSGGTLVEAFASIGWYWGGRWATTPDYQHFSATGR